MEELNIAVIVGTTREDRNSIHVARLIASIGNSFEELETILVDPLDFNLPFDGNDEKYKDPAYTEITAKADGFFIVVPEYNHSFPGTLKRLLDSELQNYIHKPVAFAGVSAGPWGGVRAIESLENSVREMGLVCTFSDVQFPNVSRVFDEGGNLLDDAYNKRVKSAYEELIWMAKAMKYGRESIASRFH